MAENRVMQLRDADILRRPTNGCKLCIGFALNIIGAIGQRRDKRTPKLLVGRKLAVEKHSVIGLFTLVTVVRKCV